MQPNTSQTLILNQLHRYKVGAMFAAKKKKTKKATMCSTERWVSEEMVNSQNKKKRGESRSSLACHTTWLQTVGRRSGALLTR